MLILNFAADCYQFQYRFHLFVNGGVHRFNHALIGVFFIGQHCRTVGKQFDNLIVLLYALFSLILPHPKRYNSILYKNYDIAESEY
jgi:hypothetical protein